MWTPRDLWIPPQAHSPGKHSDRIMIFGAGPAVGWGVLTHYLALPGSLARALSARTGRGVDVDVVATPRLSASSATQEFSVLKPWRYDAIVVTLGANDALNLTSVHSWRRELSRMLRLLEQTTSTPTHIFLVGIQPIRSIPAFDRPLGSVADHHALTLNRVTASLCDERERVTFIPLTAPIRSADRHRTAADYRDWAELLAARMSAPLDAGQLNIDDADRPVRHADWTELDHQRAVDQLEILHNEQDARLERIVALAQHSFGTRCAAFTMSAGDRQVHVTCVGVEASEVPRIISFATVATRGREPTVVPDAPADERFRGHSLVQDDPHIRFYAGFPVESPSGERIGVLCVADPNPRRGCDVDTVLLRELAMMVQAELWHFPLRR